MINPKLYDLKVQGYFKINFSDIYEFNNGGVVITYLTKELMTKQSYTLKCFNYKEDPLENNTIIYVEGVLEHDIYRDKITKEWIDKGIYINISGYKVIEKEEVERMREVYKAERNNRRLEKEEEKKNE